MLQNAFYILGIVTMSIAIVMLISIIVLLVFIKKKIGELHDDIQRRIESVTSVTSRAAEFATGIGAFVAEKAFNAKRKVKSKND